MPQNTIFYIGTKHFNEGKIALSLNGAGAIGHPEADKNKLALSLMPNAKINSKWIIDLNVKPFFKKKNRRRKSLRSRARQRVLKHQKYDP